MDVNYVKHVYMYMYLKFDVVNVVFCYVCPLKFGTDISDVRHPDTFYMKKCCMNERKKSYP